MSIALLDTEPIVAFLDPRDSSHEFVQLRLSDYTGGFVTTSSVITEAMHFVQRVRNGPRLLLQFIDQSDVEIHDCASFSQIAEAVELMEKYGDTPMDFADASLLILADDEDVTSIVTLDRRGFHVFQTSSGRTLDLWLES